MWTSLSNSQKEEYKKYCDQRFGQSFIFSELGEPLYMDSDGNMISTDMIMELLFCLCEN